MCRTVSQQLTSSMRACMWIIAPVAPIGRDDTRAHDKASDPPERERCHLPGIRIEPKEIQARSLLDAGCGDFNWMKEMKLDIDRYIGVDIVPELITANQQKYGSAIRIFIHLDITKNELPQADVILCPDCLAHFSFKDIFATIQRFKQSNCKYLLTTTFTRFPKNIDIATGGWR